MISITDVMAALAVQRPIFHSEADFQHAFAWGIHRKLPDALIRLERPLAPMDNQLHLDVWAAHKSAVLAVELKYKTRGLSIRIDDEQFALKDQAAQDISRYDYVKDIRRLEQMIAGQKDAVAYAVLLTNDSAYWTAGARKSFSRRGFPPSRRTRPQGHFEMGRKNIGRDKTEQRGRP
jgi:hypothetical protein